MSDFNPNANFTDTNFTDTDSNAKSLTTENFEPSAPLFDSNNNFVPPDSLQSQEPLEQQQLLEQQQKQPAIDSVKFNKILNAVSRQTANDLTLLKKLLDAYPDLMNNKEKWGKLSPLINQLLEVFKNDNLVEGINNVEEDASNAFENLLFAALMLGPLVGGKKGKGKPKSKTKTKKRIGKGKGNRHKKSKRRI